MIPADDKGAHSVQPEKYEPFPAGVYPALDAGQGQALKGQ
jgi:hypothetical protein